MKSLFFLFKHKTKESDILKFLQSKVAKYAIPKFIKIVNELPRTAVEKVDKKILREMAIEQFIHSKKKSKVKIK